MRIGVFDSGIGGITVLKELRRQFPEHEYLYFGDTANVPYGTKSPAQIRSLVLSASERMKAHHIEALVIACNTASSLAAHEFRSVLAPLPLLDVVDAGVQSVLDALEDRPNSPILILGTRATVRSHIYSKLLKKSAPGIQIFEQECPLLVPMIEEGWTDHMVLKLTVREYVNAYRNLEPGIALLACTHYPWIHEVFESELPGWKVLDSAKALAKIGEKQLRLSHPSTPFATTSLHWYFSDPESLSQNILSQIDPQPSSF